MNRLPVSLPCPQCGAPAERCSRCGGAACSKRLCAELHEAFCEAVRSLPTAPPPPPTRLTGVNIKKASSKSRRREDAEADRNLADELVQGILRHRRSGRDALFANDLDKAIADLLAARDLEADLDQLGTAATLAVPADMEIETDLVPLARALSSVSHPRFADIWRRVLDDRPARSVQAEAAEWLARDAFGRGRKRHALRILHAGNALGRPTEPEALREAYKRAGVDPTAAFTLYLTAVRLEPHAARAADLRDPLTGLGWVDQDPRWWYEVGEAPVDLGGTRVLSSMPDVQHEALSRAQEITVNSRDKGWLLLAEGDLAAGPTGPRVLGRNIRFGQGEQADNDQYMQIRMAYEGAADRLPDAAWPWYRLAELLAWAGFPERAREHLAQAAHRTLGDRAAERVQRPMLDSLVQVALGEQSDAAPAGPRPFPAAPHGQNLVWRLRSLPGGLRPNRDPA